MSVMDTAPSGDADTIWAYLVNGIDHILLKSNEGFEYKRYMNLYTGVYNYCTTLRTNVPLSFSAIVPDVSGSGAMLFGEQLYKRLQEHISRYMDGVAASSGQFTGDALLAYYTSEWNKYVDSAKIIHNIFSYLNRHWIKREQEEGNVVNDVNTMMLHLWREHLFKKVHKSLLDSVFKLIKRVRDGQVADVGMVKSVVDSFVSLGLDDIAANSNRKMEVYEKYFQVPFLAMSTEYYEAESARLLQEGSIRDYMVKIAQRLQEEDDRTLLYLHPDSVEPLKKALNAALIGKHREELILQFKPMLVALEKDDLHRLYTLLLRLEDSEGLEPMRRTFTEYVTNAGREAIKQISGSEDIKAGNLATESRLFVESLLRVHDLYTKMLHDSFDDNPGFSRALDSACKDFVNVNELCAPGQSRAPVLLAHYCDSLLKKGGARKAGGIASAASAPGSAGPGGIGGSNAVDGGNDEGDLEASLSQAIVVFRYIKDSDVFQKFYSRFLARRLVNEQSVSIDSEEAMISKLKEISGVDFTSKMSRMFLDMSLSGEMNDAYAQSIDGGFELPFNFNMKVLHSVSWPLSLPATQPQLPSQVAQVTDSFNRFYTLKHNGRKLDWLWQHSKAEIKMFFPRATGPAAKTGYTFQVTTYQLAILMLFNDETGPGTGYDSPNGPTLTWAQIVAATGLDDETIDGEMDVLCKARVLLSSTPKPGKTSRFTLNGGFKSKKLKMNLAATKKPEQKRENKETMKSVEQDRKYQIEAAIVRIMKARKTLAHRQLVQETISQIKLFQAQVPDIKQAIDALIEREYLERDADSRDVYQYLA